MIAKSRQGSVSLATVHINVTFNNTIITFTDMQGNKLFGSSSGKVGFKGAKKSTPYAAQMVVEKLSETARSFGVKTILLSVKGPGSQRESALRSMFQQNFIVTRIQDVSPIAHNGCRPRKRRRV